MQMYKAEGKTKPSKIDDTSSKNYVYIRENIKTEKRKDENGKNERNDVIKQSYNGTEHGCHAFSAFESCKYWQCVADYHNNCHCQRIIGEIIYPSPVFKERTEYIG